MITPARRLFVPLFLCAFLWACGSKSESVKSYEDYFPPFEDDVSGGEVSLPEEEAPVPDIFEAPAEKTPAALDEALQAENPPAKTVCRAKAAPGPRKIGKPYYVGGVKYYPLDTADGYSEEGVASWYGPGFHGKLTANGERYDQKSMTAAHKTLPLPTLVRVQNLENGREIIVRVNDRGPFSKGRIIDLTEEGARRLGMIDKGTARVRVSVLSEDAYCYVSAGREVDLDKGSFAVQVAAFSDPANASRLAARLGGKAIVNKGYVNGFLWNRVWITGYASKTSAEEGASGYKAEFPGAFVIAR